MKKLFTSMLALTFALSIGGSAHVLASEKNTKNDIVVGSVEEQQAPQALVSMTDGVNSYTLDFSCLDISVKNKKIVSTINNKKIKDVSNSKKFNAQKENKLKENARKTQTILENELNDEEIHSEINEILQEHLKKTGEKPVIGLTKAPIKTESKNNDLLGLMSISKDGLPEPSLSGYVTIYTSVSGSTSSIWGQSNAYIKNPTTTGLEINCADAISLSWNAPWKLSNHYNLTIKDRLGEIPSSIKPRSRIPAGTENAIAYKYNQKDVSGAYLGAELLNGASGSYNFYSDYIHTYNALAYTFIPGGGIKGLTVQPTRGTESVQSSVYFTI